MLQKNAVARVLKFVPWAIIALGIVLRLVVFAQNRNLIIDEANIVRNLNERSFTELLNPLLYDQFAPPLFLFVSKCSMLFFGAYEWAFRLFPFLCSIANLFLLYALLKKFNVGKAIFYPLFLFATGMIYVRYATECKQYSSDITVSLSLVLLALKNDIGLSPKFKFFLIWLFAGSIAIWLSMPSVFVLAAVGLYYFAQAQERKNLHLLTPFVAVTAIWLLQFVLYYFMLLKPSTENNYLQQAHLPNVFILLPLSTSDWQHNADAFATFFDLWAGHWALSFVFHLFLLCVGIVLLWRQDKGILILLFVPFLLLLFAVAVHQFTLLPRVCLFVYPLLLAIMGKGLAHLFSFRFYKWVLLPSLFICALTMINFNQIKWLVEAPKFDRTTDGFEWLAKRQISGDACYIHDLLRPQTIYYTSIHPDSSRWATFKNGTIFNGYTDFVSLCATAHGKVAFMFWREEQAELHHYEQVLQQQFVILDTLFNKELKTYVLERN
jgi:hypothetical protein